MLDDLLAPNLRLVICGTAASKVSARQGWYYAGPGNKFWRMLDDVGLTERVLIPKEYRQLLSYGIGLTDVVKGQSGNDNEIDFRRSDPQGVRSKVARYAPGVLAFNGKRAAQLLLGKSRVEYGLQSKNIGNTSLFVAPSTSGSACRSWNLELWKELAEIVRVVPS